MIPTRSFNLRIGMFNMIRKVGGLYHWQIGNFGGCFYRKAVKRSACRELVVYQPRNRLVQALTIFVGSVGCAGFVLCAAIAASLFI